MENNYFRYLGQKCPICEKEFNGNDDIVVCPLCGTPHHRECYKKNGECGNFDEHSKGFRWAPAEVQQTQTPPVEPQSEPQQAEDGPTSYFNYQATNTLYGTTPNPLSLFPQEIEEDIKTEEVAEFVQASAFKYIQNFFYAKSKKKSFNWMAFLLAPYWFFYRKLHKVGAIFLSLMVASAILFSLPNSAQKFSTDLYDWAIENQEVMPETEEEMQEYTYSFTAIFKNNPVGTVLYVAQLSVLIIMHLIAGFTANKLYYNHTIKKIRKIKTETQDANQQKLRYFKEGGISLSATIIAILGYELVMAVVSYLFQYI